LRTIETPTGPIVDDPENDDCFIYVSFSTTVGEYILELHRCAAPKTVDNFLQYVDDGFYDDTLIHRVENGFVIQGGGYDLDKKEKPGRPPVPNETPNGMRNNKGTISMARGMDPNGATSQFFINLRDNGSLDVPGKGGAGFTVFGRVVEGMDVVEQIGVVPTIRNPELGNIQSPIDPVQVIQAGRILGDEAKKLAEKHGVDRAAIARGGLPERTLVAWKADNRKKNETMTEEQRRDQAIEYVKERGWDVTKGILLPSGVWYLDDAIGVGDSPKVDDWVAMKWDGWLSWGEKFGAWDERKPEVQKGVVRGFVPGYQEALMSMKPQGVRLIIIPSNLAFGPEGRGNKIPPNTALIYRVELLEVLPGVAPVPEEPKKDDKAGKAE